MPFPSYQLLSFQRISVSTDGTANVFETEADLQGSVTELTSRSGDADFNFEYRETGSDSLSNTSTTTVTTTESVQTRITGLSPETEYEFKSVGVVELPIRDEGSFTTFTTPTSSPVDTFRIAQHLARMQQDLTPEYIEEESSARTNRSQMLARRAFGNQQ
jgi:hypothetical protein